MKAALRVLTPTGALRAGTALLVTILGFGLALGLTIGYVAHTRQQDDRRWCQLLGTFLTPPQPAGPPANAQEARGRQITDQIRQLYHQLGCG